MSNAIKDPERTNHALTLIVDILSSQSRDMKEMKSTIDNLVDENKSLATKLAELRETQAVESSKLSKKIQRLTSDNEKLADLLKIRTEESERTKSNFVNTYREFLKETINRSNDSIISDNGNTVSTENKVSKRILMHSDTDILSLVTTHGIDIQKLQTDVAALKTGKSNGQSGSTYVRWGRNNCSGNATELVYAGYAAGSDYRDTGAAANYLCLSPDPLWGHYNDAQNAGATVMGVEYELYGTLPGDTTPFFNKNLHIEDAPCSVCRSPRSTVIMIPGRNQCYKGWTLEYKGYLVAGYHGHTNDFGHKAASEYVCLDDSPDVIPGGHTNQNGALFYMVEGHCGSLLCPPYVEGRELTCVVCSK